MSTAPKINYAKVGKASKNKAQSVSSELLRSSKEKSDDIFSHMNQQNLNYIKKQLKMKKNRSQHERSRSPERDPVEAAPDRDEQVTQRYKLYQKYRGEQQVSQKEPHLQDTQRRSQSQKRVIINLPQQVEQDYQPSDHHNSKPYLVQKQFLATSHHGINPTKATQKVPIPQNKMYQSLPYEDAKKRIASIQGYFGQAVSTNLNRQQGLFMEFLEQYISDLNHSKHLKSRDNLQASIEKRKAQQNRIVSRQAQSKRQSTKGQQELRRKKEKLEQINRNSDTFGQRNSKFTANSHRDEDSSQYDLELKLKQQKFNSLVLAQQLRKQKQILLSKDKTIKKLQIQNDLLRQEIRHINNQQEIIKKNKQARKQTQYIENIYHKYKNNLPNDQNEIDILKEAHQISGQHKRYASSNHQKTSYSHRSSVKYENPKLFQQFSAIPDLKIDKNERSIQSIQKQYQQFCLQLDDNKKRPIFKERATR